MMDFIVDVSAWNTYLHPAQLPSGVTGLIVKATEGSSYQMPLYAQYVKDCANAGIPMLPYHFLHGDISLPAQMANVANTVTPGPITVDVEPTNSSQPTIKQAVEMVNRLYDAGYTVPFIYIPHWYWQSIGSPDLSLLPPLWASDYVIGSGQAWFLYQSVSADYWNGYGGNTVVGLQFTSSYLINNESYDCSAFNGFAELIGKGADMTPQESQMLSDLHSWLSPQTLTLPDGSTKTVSPIWAIMNTYQGMFFGGESTPNQESLFALVTPPPKPAA